MMCSIYYIYPTNTARPALETVYEIQLISFSLGRSNQASLTDIFIFSSYNKATKAIRAAANEMLVLPAAPVYGTMVSFQVEP